MLYFSREKFGNRIWLHDVEFDRTGSDGHIQVVALS